MATEIALKTESALGNVTVGDIMVNVPLLQQIDHMAQRMASAKATIPKHLQNNEGDCWAVIMQAIQWGMNPYVVGQKTHLVNGTLGYEAQLVNAVVQASGAIVGAFHYEYEGEGNALQCRVGARLRGDQGITWGEWLSFASVKVKNSPLWATNPKQQMGYLQLKNWVRLYAPGPLLGIYTTDELEDMPPGEREIGPAAKTTAPETTRTSAIKDKLKAREAEQGTIIDHDAQPDPELEPEPLPLAAEMTFAQVADAINTANSPESLQAAVALMAEFIGIDGNEQYKDELGANYRAKLAKLKAANK